MKSRLSKLHFAALKLSILSRNNTEIYRNISDSCWAESHSNLLRCHCGVCVQGSTWRTNWMESLKTSTPLKTISLIHTGHRCSCFSFKDLKRTSKTSIFVNMRKIYNTRTSFLRTSCLPMILHLYTTNLQKIHCGQTSCHSDYIY